MALLLARTHYSLLTAPASPRELCEEAVRRGADHLVLADANGLYGLWPFAREAARVGLRAVFGAELVHGGGRLCALARDRAGYSSLCELLSGLHLDPEFDLARAAEMHRRGLFFVCGDLGLLPALAARLSREQLFVALAPRAVRASIRHGEADGARGPDGRKLPDPGPQYPRQQRIEAAEALGLALVAVRDVWFPRPEHHGTHLLFLAVKWNRAFDPDDPARGLSGIRCAQPCMHLPERGRGDEGWEDFPSAIACARGILEACDLSFPERSPVVFPEFRVPDGETPAGHLRSLALAGLRRRIPDAGEEVLRRLQAELAVIERMGFSPYFLVVNRIAGIAREKGIPFVGRGSAADSLVAYALGLTDADPIRYGLLFERFLNPARDDLPDIDLDFCWRRRDELIDAVYEQFGRDRVAMIATHGACGIRSAYAEAAKAAGLPPAEVARRTRLLPWHGRAGEDLERLIARTRGFFGDRPVTPAREHAIAQAAQRLLLAPRLLGVHPGGIVLTPGPIRRHAPLERAAKGVVVTQYDMRFVEGLGLVKIDLLGNRALSIVDDCARMLRENGVAPPDLSAVPEDDPRTAALLREGRTLACFQVESPAMRTLLRSLSASDMGRVIQAVALVRPGPASAGMKDAFVRRARGLEPATAAHPLLEQVFGDTFGIMLYQEDVIRAAMAVAGMDPSDGDRLRRDLAKGDADGADLDAFVVAGLRRGLPRAAAERVWREMERFAGYSFCKAHAVTYGRLAYRCVYLKAHWPGAFLAAVLNNDAGYYAKGVYVEEAKRLGIRMAPPCVQRGAAGFELLAFDRIRVGLSEVRGLGEATLDRLLRARRAGGAFASLEDFLRRVEPRRDEAENLILCGALDGLGRSRPELLWRLKVATSRRGVSANRTPAARGLFDGVLDPPSVDYPDLPELSPEQRVRWELEVLGYSLDEHPVDLIWRRADLPMARGCVPCGRIEEFAGRRVRLFGWVVASRGHRTDGGAPMRFWTLEDGTGIAECVAFPAVLERLGGEMQGRGPFVVAGRVEERNGGLALHLSSARKVPDAGCAS
ncbi:MAG: DNA polymerase III subunit alpha [Planctomycetota bacterium]